MSSLFLEWDALILKPLSFYFSSDDDDDDDNKSKQTLFHRVRDFDTALALYI